MSEVLEIAQAETDQLAPITKVESEIARMKKDFSGLTIANHTDKAGFKAVYNARQEAKNLRVEVEHGRKKLVEASVRWQKTVNTKAKEISSQIEEIENGLKAKEDAYLIENERIKKEAELKRQRKIHERTLVITSQDARYNGFGYMLGDVTITTEEIESLSDSDFQTRVEAFEAAYQVILEEKKEADRIAKEKAEQLEAQRKEQEAAAAELKRQQDELAAERRKIEEEKAEIARQEKERLDKIAAEEKAKQDAIEAQKREEKRLADLEAARVEAAEKARIEAEAKAKREAEEKAAAEKLAAEKEARRLARRPDLEKYNDMAATVLAIVDSYKFKTDEGVNAHATFRLAIELAVKSSVLLKAE